MKRRYVRCAAGLCGLLVSALIMLTACAHLGADENRGVHRVSKEQLLALLEAGDTVVIDVRSERDWENSPLKIPGAVRQAPTSGDPAWASAYPKDTPIHLYCA